MIDEEHQVEGMQGSTVNPEVEGFDSEQADSDGGDANEQSVTLDQVSFPDIDSAETSDFALVEADYQAKIAAMTSEVQTLKAQLEDRNGQYMRIAADFDNYRKRTQREKEELDQQIKCSTINELLPVVDNFERARSQIKPQTDQETTIHKSYQSVYKQLVDCLKRIGVSPMRAEGSEFDPALHEAVMRQPTSEYAEGIVMEELQRGYMLGDRVLRHALVKVAAPPEEGEATEASNQETSDG